VFIKSLNINNLRNIKLIDIDLNSGLNFLIGDNGAGKTTVLESIVVLAKGRSFRSGQISALIGPETDRFRVVAKTSKDNEQQQTLGLERSRVEWKARRNGEDLKQLSDLAIYLPLVLIEPNSHLLISGPPDGRRRFLDWGVFHVEHDFLINWRRYSRALKQRNAALRKQHTPVIESLDEILSDLGEKIDAARQKQMKRLSQKLENTISGLSPGLGNIHLNYERGWKGNSLFSALRENLQQDLDRCSTGPGPHRAEIPVFQGKKPAKERLSRGEQKILSASLLLSQARLMAEAGEKPLLLMDDLASEFDKTHLASVLEASTRMNTQLWITGTSYGPYRALEDKAHSMFHVKHGRITTETTT
jgi:DNA replication and repair protein RecF